MISKLEFKNYKSFKSKQSLDIEPITVLIGPNSAGKSSIQKLLALLVQSNTTDMGQLVKWRGPLVDLSSFKEASHRGNHEPIQIRLQSSHVAFPLTEEEIFGKEKHRPASIDLQLIINSNDSISGKIGNIGEPPFNYSCHLWHNETALIRGELFQVAPSRHIVERYRKFICEYLKKQSNWVAQHEQELGSFGAMVEKYLNRYLPGETDQRGIFPSEWGSPMVRNVANISGFGDDNLSPTFDDTSREEINSNWEKLLAGLDSSKPLDAKAIRKRLITYIRKSILLAGKELSDFMEKSNKEMKFLKEKTDILLREMEFFPPLREKPKPFYTRVELLELTGRKDFKDEEFSAFVNYYLRLLGFEKEMEIQRISDRESLFRIILRDNITGHESSIADVGYGYSQVLPMIFSKTRSRKTILLEQPELHLHPLAQSKLADLLITDLVATNPAMGLNPDSPLDGLNRYLAAHPHTEPVVRSHLSNQYIVETHSEALLRALQLKVAEGVLSHDDIVIYYVSNNHLGNGKIEQIKIDPNGFFDKPIPEGFYDSSTSLLEKLWEVQK